MDGVSPELSVCDPSTNLAGRPLLDGEPIPEHWLEPEEPLATELYKGHRVTCRRFKVRDPRTRAWGVWVDDELLKQARTRYRRRFRTQAAAAAAGRKHVRELAR